MAHRAENFVHLREHSRGFQISALKSDIADAFYMDGLQWNVRSTYSVGRFVFLCKLVGIDAGVLQDSPHRADAACNFALRLCHQYRFVAADFADTCRLISQSF